MSKIPEEKFYAHIYGMLYTYSNADLDECCRFLVDQFGDGAQDGFVDWVSEKHPEDVEAWQ